MEWVRLNFGVASEELQEELVAELAELAITSFLQTEQGVEISLPADEFESCALAIESAIESQSIRHNLAIPYRTERFEERNWNREWEESLRPFTVGRFLIVPDRSRVKVPEGFRLLRIEPKMSFGTGLHETTRLMLLMLEKTPSDRLGKVLDAGTGTGILAIAAARLGASEVFAFDFDPLCEKNAIENIRENGVDEVVTVCLGGIETADGIDPRDLVLANINRNAILEMMPAFHERLRPGGTLLLSGLLERDRAGIEEAAAPFGLTLTESERMGEWIALRFERTSQVRFSST